MELTKDAIRILDKVATWLEAGAPHKDNHGMSFDMAETIRLDKGKNLKLKEVTNTNWCGTACCIAGAAVSFELPQRIVAVLRDWNRGLVRFDDTWDLACNLLIFGNDSEAADLLFQPWEVDEDDDGFVDGTPRNSEEITSAWAARTIRHLIATGNINWGVTKDAAALEAV